MEKKINKAKNILKKGGLVIFPTETVYGLGGDATNDIAIRNIYNIKKRPTNNPIICHFKDFDSVREDFQFNDIAYNLAKEFWPGPLTLILEKKKKSKISFLLSNKNNFVGCRVPKNSIANNLLKSLDFPLAAPSANLSTKLSSTKIMHLSEYFKEKIYFIDGGKCLHGLESTVVDVSNEIPMILRLGAITYEEIKKIIPKVTIKNKINNFLSPGQQDKHYSPNKPIRINVEKVFEDEALLNFGSNDLKSNIAELNLSVSENLNEAANNFFDFLHLLDNSDSKGIAVAPIPNDDLGKTINDRLARATTKN